jgi:hypothetical protein
MTEFQSLDLVQITIIFEMGSKRGEDMHAWNPTSSSSVASQHRAWHQYAVGAATDGYRTAGNSIEDGRRAMRRSERDGGAAV